MAVLEASRVPTRADAVLFALKMQALRARRFVLELGRAPKRLPRTAAAAGVIVAQSRAPLWGETRAGEQRLQQGKVENLRVAARRLDGTVLEPGAVFSFWRQMGRASARRGFVEGRMLQEGCLVPAVGGGLCQLSNALYDVALQAECAIVERHAHSRRVPGAATPAGRDATVAWNYVDLRFVAPERLVLRVALTRDALVVSLLKSSPRHGEVDTRSVPGGEETSPLGDGGAGSCDSCDRTDCFRHQRTSAVGRTAFLVDENWPELRAFVARTRKDGDVLALPLDGARWGVARYRWETDGFARVQAAPVAALLQGFALRRAKDGPQRRAAEIKRARAMAVRAARVLTPDMTDVVVAQSLLPHLWRDGHLGGRRVTVLMTRMPTAAIQARLDAATRKFPDRASLADFRADPALVTAETQALAAADTIVTPHAEIAALFAERAALLDWATPAPVPRGTIVPGRIAFAGPTIARKGAYEVREAAQALDLEVVLLGAELEDPDFWRGVRTRRDGLEGAMALVQPALLEDAPRRVLAALANGMPVIATAACGLPARDGLMLVPSGDADALIAALRAV
jgi:hypothetical protein